MPTQNFLKMIFMFQEKNLLLGDITKMQLRSSMVLYYPQQELTSFWESGIDNSPLRNLLYYSPNYLVIGHVVARLSESIIVQFLQAYEINTVKFWMWDGDTRQTDIQVFTIAKDGQTENIIFDGFTQPTIMVVKFSDQLASGLRFYNRGGNTKGTQYMSIIKIQAFYAF
ncbi:unnamed protein product [Paramecium primaurelia]|uniref:Uncharacterized protein n=1 Tax=Paramecium primaurelia TaxID=5886 RepID=A0A8S1NEQ4_PARPR|nr:unnamed protein product [Paramecium primaurelia]